MSILQLVFAMGGRGPRRLALWGLVALGAGLARAEVVTDGSLGAAGALPGPDFKIGADLGQQRGGNLFHSFQSFNLSAGESATFSGPPEVQNIIGRITGGAPSSLDGGLRSEIPGAALYLFNPAGLAFGPRASIDIAGSFHAATADTLRFADGGEFSAGLPQGGVLSSAPPQAFGFLGAGAAPLGINGSTLHLPAGAALSLHGGTLDIDYTRLRVTDGQIDLRSQGELRVHDAQVDSSGPSGGRIRIVAGHLELDEGELLADTLGAGAGGGIQVQADSLTTTEGGRLSSSTFGGGTGGDIHLQVSGAVDFAGERLATASGQNEGLSEQAQTNHGQDGEGPDTEDDIIAKNQVYAGLFAYAGNLDNPDSGAGGTIYVRAGSLDLRDGARITTETFGAGQGGEIRLEIEGTAALSGATAQGESSSLLSEARGRQAPAGRAGDIDLRAGALHLADGASISTATYGPGQGGTMRIAVAGPVILSGADRQGSSTIFADARETPGQPAGDGGGLELSARELELRDGAGIYANTFGAGRGGEVDIRVDGAVRFSGQTAHGDGSEIYVNTYGSGPGGSLRLAAGSLGLADGARITTSTFGPGESGSIYLDVRETVRLTGEGSEGTSGLYTLAKPADASGGDAGSIQVQAGALELRDGAGIYADTFGNGQGGSIRVQVRGPVSFAGRSRDGDGSEIYANARGTGPDAGDGGTLEIEAGSLDLADGAKLDTSTYGPGLGGNIRVRTTGEARFAGSSVEGAGGIFTVSAGTGQDASRAGAIAVQAQRLVLDDGAEINAGTRGPGAGGDIDLAADDILLQNGGTITASSRGSGSGVAGHVALDIAGQLRLRDGYIRTGTDSADGGDIRITGQGYCYLRGGEISTSVNAAQGNGGNISLHNSFLLLDNSRILARAVGGNGGNIDIATHGIFRFSPSLIDASSQFGVSGVVQFNTPDVRVGDQLAVLSTAFLDAQSLQQTRCGARGGEPGSRFTLSRYRGNARAGQRAWLASGTEGPPDYSQLPMSRNAAQ